MISSLLWRLVDIIRSRFLWVTIGIILLLLLIWFAGPLFAFGDIRPLESRESRLWLIGAVLGLFLLRWTVRRWRASKINERLADLVRESLNKKPEGSEEVGNVGALEEKFDAALATLRKARFESEKHSFWERMGGRRYLYELPWYVIIGSPGAGKTTVLANSGLSFPLAKQFGNAALPGAGGTRYCDWWFTNEAVFIDTAGRYTTHESDEQVDRAEWQGFLGLLKKSRNRQPINGVLLTLSVADLLQQTPEQRKFHAAAIRNRLDELREDLGVLFPVYVLVTKCDLLLGFDEYFADLDRAGREQVHGFTLPLDGALQYHPDSNHVVQELKLLQARIYDGLVDRLQAEPDLGLRSRIYAYPQEFGVVAGLVQEAVAAIFEDSRYSSPPLLRGVYFTSGTQEGAPFDRILSAMRAGLEATHKPRVQQGSGKSFFIRELLTKVVFGEAYIVGSDAKAERRAKFLHIGGCALSVLLLVAVISAAMVSYRNNQKYIVEVDHKIDKFEEELKTLPGVGDGNFYALLPLLNAAEQLPDSANFPATSPLLPWTFGLYQGDKLAAGARPIYENLLKEHFAPTLKLRLEQLLRTVAVDDLEFAFETLKAYIMMHEPRHLREEDFVAFVLADWDKNMAAAVARVERAALERHVRALIATGSFLPDAQADQTLIETTRSRLSQYPVSQRIYRRMVRMLNNKQLPNFSVAAAVGPDAARIFRRTSNQALTDGVSSLYTFRGYHELFEPEVDSAVRGAGMDDAWVLGVSEGSLKQRMGAVASGELSLEVKRHYMRDYVREWEKFLDDVTLVEPESLSEASELAGMLSAPDSPLMRFMNGVVRETTLTAKKSSNDDSSLLARVGRSVRATGEDITRIIGPSSLPGALSPMDRPELIVDNRFEALRKAAGGAGESSSLQALTQIFAELHMYLSGAEAARVGGYAPPAGSSGTNTLRAQAARLPQPGRRLLETVASSSEKLVTREIRRSKGRELQGMVTRACLNSIQGRYPLVRTATREVALDDFTRMFGPGGRMEEYFQRELASFVDVSKSPWRLREGAQGGLGSATAVAAFEKAHVIKDVFFRAGTGTPKITIAIKPVLMDTTITTLTLDVDGQIVRYQHGPQVSYTVSWPGTRGSNQVRLSLEPPLPEGRSGLVLEGPWALHRLFDKANIRSGGSPERFTADIEVGGRNVRFEVIAASVKNPFRLQELTGFSCPDGL